MAKDLRISYLLDFYGEMLTVPQREAVDAYYNQDMSLSEIAADRDISRQGVRDAIKRAEQLLCDMEDRLGLAKRFEEVQAALVAVCDCALDIQELTALRGGDTEIDERVGAILELCKAIAEKE